VLALLHNVVSSHAASIHVPLSLRSAQCYRARVASVHIPSISTPSIYASLSLLAIPFLDRSHAGSNPKARQMVLHKKLEVGEGGGVEARENLQYRGNVGCIFVGCKLFFFVPSSLCGWSTQHPRHSASSCASSIGDIARTVCRDNPPNIAKMVEKIYVTYNDVRSSPGSRYLVLSCARARATRRPTWG
jgi:hypothetical protein